MIGFIALAGIIVRNSILLVDFIRMRQGHGEPLRDVLLEAGAIRFKPIFLTAVAAMIGAAFILADPIFQGLAISLVFGLASSTALTLLVIPALYVVLARRPPADDPELAEACGLGANFLAVMVRLRPSHPGGSGDWMPRTCAAAMTNGQDGLHNSERNIMIRQNAVNGS